MSEQQQQQQLNPFSTVKHIILVLSGKGGVGKSTVACQLASSLARGGKDGKSKARVGLLDVDICGPSVPKIMGVEGSDIMQGQQGWLPVDVKLGNDAASDNASSCLKVMSVAFLLPSDRDAVVWRGPRKDAMIKQFVTDVEWGELDYLIVDTPPGTSDEHMTLCEVLRGYNPSGAVIVTTPQQVSTDDVRKELSFCHKLKLRCLGIVENMSGYVCPYCAECTQIFSRGGGRKLAEAYEVKFLGEIPIDPILCLTQDSGRTADGEGASSSNGGDDGKESPSVAAVGVVIANIQAQVKRVEELSADLSA